MTDKDFIASIVSRETFRRLEIYADLLEKWNPRINLVAKSTMQSLWTRHIYDSIQFFDLIESNSQNWLDLGSGGGFPGLVLAIMAMERPNAPHITLVESDQRKAVFLRTVLRETKASGTVLSQRIEEIPPQNADILTARALADLKTLLGFADLHLAADGVAIFAKGANWKKEVSDASATWQYGVEEVKSKTDPAAVLLKIQGITHV